MPRRSRGNSPIIAIFAEPGKNGFAGVKSSVMKTNVFPVAAGRRACRRRAAAAPGLHRHHAPGRRRDRCRRPHDRMGRQRSEQPLCRRAEGVCPALLHARRYGRDAVHGPLRLCRAVGRARGVRGRGTERGGAVGRTLLLSGLRRVRGLRSGAEGGEHRRLAARVAGVGRMPHDRRGEGAARQRACHRHRPARLDRALAFRRRFGTSGSAGDRGPPCGVL